MKKKIISFIMIVTIMIVTITGCGETKTEKYPEKVTFTYVTAPLNIPSIVERAEHIFADEFEDM